MKNRRDFISKLGVGASALATGLVLSGAKNANAFMLEPQKPISANDKIKIGLIGSGIIGHYDLDTALKVPGVEVVAVCDLYEGRRIRAKEKWGKDIFTTNDYRELLSKKDIDAVLVCTSDHWHDRISIDAMNAGKHVYCEKPMVHHIEEGHAVIATQRKTGKVFQVGSQRASSVGVLKAKEIYQQGLIGDIVFVEASNDRNSANGAWQYSIPTDSSPQTVDWDKYLGDAPKVPFDSNRFFRWRNYSDYGTGVAGDLFVHLITGLHVITGSIGPEKIFALGSLNYWKDGRDAYDLVNGVMSYGSSDKHKAFQFVTRVNLADGGGGSGHTRIVGTEGVIEMGWDDIKVKRAKKPIAPGFGGYDSYDSFSSAQKIEFEKAYYAKFTKEQSEWKDIPMMSFDPPANYDDRLDHMIVFFNAIRGQNKIIEDATFGLRAAGPSLACNLSAKSGKPIIWDALKMKVVQ